MCLNDAIFSPDYIKFNIAQSCDILKEIAALPAMAASRRTDRKSAKSSQSKVFENICDIDFDLQIFAEDSPTGQKTESATPRRREKAREEGQLAKSADLNAVVVLLLGFITTYYSGNYILSAVVQYLKITFSNLIVSLDAESINKILINFNLCIWMAIAPVVAVTFTAALSISFYQSGFTFSVEPLMFNPGHFNPVNGLMKIFSREPFIELLKSMVKVAVVIYFPYSFFSQNIKVFSKFMSMDINQILIVMGPLLYELILKILIVLLIFAIADYAYQYYEFEKRIMMSKYDIKQEYKQEEGDPMLKQEMRRRARKLAMGQMMSQVPKAKVVVTNPTHISVALAYEGQGTGSAPVVVAKGSDFVALKIRELAKEHGVPLYENVPLARELYQKVEVGEAIPEELYQAVASIFIYLNKMGHKVI